MAQSNIIPDEVPKEIWKERKFDDIILYALGVFGPLEREVFINISGDTKKINNRMNKNTFHKWAKELKGSNYIKVNKDNRTSIYRITQKGLDELLRRLEDYNLDFEILNKIEQERIQNYIESIKSFFIKYEIYNNDIKTEFLELVNEITYDKLNQTYSEEKFNKLLLFLTLNHPKFYPIYNISQNDFISKYNKQSDTINENLTEADMSTFSQKIFSEKIYGDRLYRLSLRNNFFLYFRMNGEYGKQFEAIVRSKFKYLYNLKNLGIIKLTIEWLDDIYDEILDLLIDQYKLFKKDLRDPLKILLDEYLEKLQEDFKKSLLRKRDQLPFLSLPNKKKIKKKVTDIEGQELDNLEDQLKDLDELIVKNPEDHENYFKKAEIYEKIGEYEDALKAIEKSIKTNTKAEPEILRLNAVILLDLYESESDLSIPLENALEIIQKAIDLSENKTFIVDCLKIKKNIYLAKEDLEMANNVNEEAFELYKKFPFIDKNNDQEFRRDYYQDKAEILHGLGQEKEAKELIENAIKSKILSLNDYFEFLLFDIEDYEKALEINEKLLKEDPENSDYIFDKALVYFNSNKYQDCLEYIDKILISKTNLEEELYIIKVPLLVNMMKYDEALILIDNLIKEYPVNKMFYYLNLSEIFFQLRRYEDSLYITEKLIYLDPDDDEYYRDKIYRLVKLGKLGFAENEIEKLLKKDPNNLENIRLNGIFLVALKDYQSAIEQFEKCLNLEEDHFGKMKIYKHLGKAYKRMGDNSKALESYKKAKQELAKEKELDNDEINNWKNKIDKSISKITEIM